MTALRLTNISKRFGPHVALEDVSFDVHGGEVHALLGENGAGKTTLMRIAYGLTAPDGGEIIVTSEKPAPPRGAAAGQEVRSEKLASPLVARSLGIGMVHQHFTSIPALTVAENVALAAGWRGGRQHVARAAEVIARLGMPLEPTTVVAELSVQLRQRLEIVQALASDAKILLLDEPTAVLAPREVQELLDLVRRFRDQGGAVVLISHKLAEVAQVADRVTVLRRGAVTLAGPAASFDAQALSRAMIGADPASRPEGRGRGLRGAVSAELQQARVELPGMLLHSGQIVGIAAIEGNGQRDVLRAIGGVTHHHNVTAVHGRVAFVPEDRTTEALIGPFSLSANYLLGNLDQMPRFLDWPQLHRDTAALLTQYDVRGGAVAEPAASLSGGNQQKFILGRALERRPDVLVVENPTRGLDVLASSAIHAALRQAAAHGSCVLIHSSDLDEVLALADRLLVMTAGSIRELPITTSRDAVGDAMLGIA